MPPAERMDLTQRRAVLRAFDEIGLRKVQREFAVDEWRLKEILRENDVYQDWIGTHARAADSRRRVRLYPWPSSGPDTGRKARRRAAEHEFKLLERTDHPGILRAHSLKETERGLALIFEHPEPSEPLDAFLARRAASLDLRSRLVILRDIADAIAYAAPSPALPSCADPHAVLVTQPTAMHRMSKFSTGNSAPSTRVLATPG